MKKAKIALSAIALLGVTGSIFAFKAAKRTGTLPYYITSVSNAAANITWTRGITAGTGGTGITYFFTKVKSNPAVNFGTVTKGL